MQLVEVIRCVTTSDETFEAGKQFAAKLGKIGIPTRDSAGFIMNRLLVPYMLIWLGVLARRGGGSGRG